MEEGAWFAVDAAVVLFAIFEEKGGAKCEFQTSTTDVEQNGTNKKNSV